MREPNVRRLQHRIDVQQWIDWQTYMEMVPVHGGIAQERHELGVAKICQTLVNLWRGKDDEPRELDDFLMLFGDKVDGFFNPKPFPKKEKTQAEIDAEVQMNLFAWVEGNNRVKGQDG